MKKEEQLLPKLNYSYDKNVFKYIFYIIIYISPLLFQPIVEGSDSIKNIIGISYYILAFIIGLILFKSELKKDGKVFKNNARKYINYILSILFIELIASVVATNFASLISGSNTTNEQHLSNLAFGVTTILAVIYAPLVEELVFRVSLRKLIKKDFLFIVISTIAFALIHCIRETSVINAIVNSLPYIVPGLALSYTYVKTNNIFACITLHFMMNALQTIITFISQL